MKTNTEIFELAWRLASLLLAFVILPAAWAWTLWRLRHQDRSAPRFELFVGFGTLGGWFLSLAFAGSGPLIILPLAGFQWLVAMPASIICLYRLGRPAPLSGYRTAALTLLICDIATPILLLALPGL